MQNKMVTVGLRFTGDVRRPRGRVTSEQRVLQQRRSQPPRRYKPLTARHSFHWQSLADPWSRGFNNEPIDSFSLYYDQSAGGK